MGPTIDTRFLNSLGLLERLPVWRAAFAKRGLALREPEAASAGAGTVEATTPALSSTQPPRTAKHPAEPVAGTRTATTGQPESGKGTRTSLSVRFSARRWLYAGTAAALLVLLTLWLQALIMLKAPAPVRAVTQSQAPQAVPPAPAPEPAPVAVAPVEPSEPGSQEAPVADGPAVSEAPSAPSEPEPAPAITSPTKVPPAVPPSVAAQQKASSPEFRLNGIFYTVSNPSAIVNGEMVHVGDQVGGATVVGIRQMGVTLKVKGQLKTLSLE